MPVRAILIPWLLILLAGSPAHGVDAPESLSTETQDDAQETPDPTAAAARIRRDPLLSRRIPEDWVEAPAAVTVVGPADIQLGRQQLGLDESLARVPGLHLKNRYNFAQDLRISSRGFGARSSFGIRGLKVLVDGIPATLPDGQTGVDAIDLGSVGRIEVLRGPASSLYGSAAGGVILIHSEEPPDVPFVEARAAFGALGFAQQQLKAAGRLDSVDYLVSLGRLHLDGYRKQSGTRSSILNSRFRWQIDEDSQLSFVVNAVDSAKADDPGGLTREQVHEDRRQARPRNLLFDAGEELDQQKLGLVYQKAFGDGHEVAARGYFVWRDFANRLPFTSGGAVEIGRLFAGGGLAYRYQGTILGRQNHWIVGVDLDAQRDDRKRFDNLLGTRGALVFEQQEDVTSWGFYTRNEIDLGGDVQLGLGARFDRVEFDVTDEFLADGDGSGSQSFHELSPAASLLWHPHRGFNLYGRVSTSFETPTTTEFANPSGAGGFNSGLDPQRATSYEVGVKGLLPGRFRYEVAVYRVDVKDELVPFELESMPGRSFFRNAGKSRRRGVEAALAVEPTPGLTLSLAYTWSDLRYRRYETPGGVFDGNRIPGAPRNQFFAEVAYHHASGFTVVWDALYFGHVYADDANQVKDGSSLISNLRIAWSCRRGPWQLTPFVGVNNLFDRATHSNLRINAFGGRFFEPGPDRNLFGGLSLRFEFGSPRG